MIVSLTGPSGAGKTTLLRNLLTALPEARPLVSYTTRAARQSDEPGEYAYVCEEEFDALRERGEFLWEAQTTGRRYGTRAADVDTALAGGLYIPILVPDAAQKLYVYARAPNKTGAALFIYMRIAGEEELRRRFERRGDAAAEVEARIAQCRSWEEEARDSGVPFVFIDAARAPEAVLAQALTALPQG